MEIQVITTISGAVKMESIEDLQDGDKLYYEIGRYRVYDKVNGYGSWRGSGMFKEIRNVVEFISLDKRLSDPDYLKHHNFMIVRPATTDDHNSIGHILK